MANINHFKMVRQLTFVIIFTLLYAFNVRSQVFTSSNLPIVIVNTDIDPVTGNPSVIVDEPKVLGSMKIIFHTDGSRNYLSDINNSQHLNYDGRIGIELRGSTSQSLPKKPYSLTTLQADNSSNNNVSLLGMPAENDWILNSFAFEPTLIRDYLSYNISSSMGNYATRTVYCEVVINGDYRGLYLLQEKIKSNTNSVDVTKIGKNDIAGTNLTGGYITKADKTTGGDPVAWTMSSYSGWVDYIHELPKPADVKSQQDAYIHGEFTKLETTSHANNSSLLDGYPTVIDIPSFIDFMLSNELAANVDAYQYSTYFHKDKEGKLRAGPIWDMNLTYGNDLFTWGYNRSKTNIWQFASGGNDGSKFWKDLYTNPTFRCYLSKRWNELTASGQPMNYQRLATFIDNTVLTINEAKDRESQRWGRVGNHPDSIAKMKGFINSRIAWISANVGSFSACSNVSIPPLVISKIDYQPATSGAFPSSSDQEFIEIKNIGTAEVNLSGIYLKELGISYQFPYNSTVAGGASIFLASNPTVFQTKYGITAFGKYYRNLSNTTHDIVLADAFGNIIDRVEYRNSGSWPIEAAGLGSYLKLVDLNSDNNDGSNWIASSDVSLPLVQIAENSAIQIFPNPVSSILNIQASQLFDKIEMFDVSGNLVRLISVDSYEIQLDISEMTNGFYLLRFSNSEVVKTAKILKR